MVCDSLALDTNDQREKLAKGKHDVNIIQISHQRPVNYVVLITQMVLAVRCLPMGWAKQCPDLKEGRYQVEGVKHSRGRSVSGLQGWDGEGEQEVAWHCDGQQDSTRLTVDSWSWHYVPRAGTHIIFFTLRRRLRKYTQGTLQHKKMTIIIASCGRDYLARFFSTFDL